MAAMRPPALGALQGSRRPAPARPAPAQTAPVLGRRIGAVVVPGATTSTNGVVHGAESLTKARGVGTLSTPALGGPETRTMLREAAAATLSAFLVNSGRELLPGAPAPATHMAMCPLAWAHSSSGAGTLMMAGSIVPDAHGTPTAVVALAAQLSRQSADMTARLQDVQLRAHWACTKGEGRSWKAPPPGWQTRPEESRDAGGGSWQTSFADQNGVRTLVLQVPLTGVLGESGSGLAMVLTTSGNHWLKQVAGGDKDGELKLADIFFPTHALPAIIGGTSSSSGGPATSTTANQQERPAWHTLWDQEGVAAVAEAEAALGDTWAARLQDTASSQTTVQQPQAPKAAASAAAAAASFAKDVAGIGAAARGIVSTPPEAKAVSKVEAGGEVVSKVAAAAAAPPPKKKKKEVSLSLQVSQLGVSDGVSLERFIAGFSFSHRPPGEINVGGNMWQQSNTCNWMVDSIAGRESGAQRSLMHRYDEGTALVEHASAVGDWNERQSAVCGVAVWLRLSAMRLLTWNKNYNIKPRELSQAQDRLCSRLCELWAASGHGSGPELRPLVRLALSSVGRGGQGDVGQRVRDEILEVQQRNRCKGGMMEEWHQKLHNNTSPDDVVICEALLAYCASGLDISAYWNTLHAANINAERLASFDRSIRSEPRFDKDQVPGLTRDLTAYLHTLRAVHCGTDLASAAANVLGYSSRDLKGHKEITISAVPNVASAELRTLLGAALHLQQVLSGVNASGEADPHVLQGTVRLMELLVEARHVIRSAVLAGDSACGGRHRDVVFLDIALEGALRTALEGSLGGFRSAAAQALASPPSGSDYDYQEGAVRGREGEVVVGGVLDQLDLGDISMLEALGSLSSGGKPDATTGTQRISLLLAATCLAVESAALSSYPNEELTSAMKWLSAMNGMTAGELQRDRAMQALSVVDRLKRTLDSQSTSLVQQLQPSVQALGQRLSLPGHALNIFGEEVVRGTAAAPLSQLLGVVEPCLRRLVGSGEWQVVSRGGAEKSGGVVGQLVKHNTLDEVQYKTYSEPTVLVVDNLQGHEEVPEGCVAVISAHGQCPDMLSHSAVRARNMDVLLAACHNEGMANGIKQMGGRVRVTLTGQDVKVTQA